MDDMKQTAEAAAYLGITERHFRRLYLKTLEATPGPSGGHYYRTADLDAIRQRRARTAARTGPIPASGSMTPAMSEAMALALTLVGSLEARAVQAERRERDALATVGALREQNAALRRLRWPWQRRPPQIADGALGGAGGTQLVVRPAAQQDG